MSPRTGRPKSDNPKSTVLRVRVDEDALEVLDECAQSLNTNKSEIVRKGIYLVQSEIQKK